MTTAANRIPCSISSASPPDAILSETAALHGAIAIRAALPRRLCRPTVRQPLQRVLSQLSMCLTGVALPAAQRADLAAQRGRGRGHGRDRLALDRRRRHRQRQSRRGVVRQFDRAALELGGDDFRRSRTRCHAVPSSRRRRRCSDLPPQRRGRNQEHGAITCRAAPPLRLCYSPLSRSARQSRTHGVQSARRWPRAGLATDGGTWWAYLPSEAQPEEARVRRPQAVSRR